MKMTEQNKKTLLPKLSQEADNVYKNIFKDLSKLNDIDLEHVMCLCILYTNARLSTDKPFILDGCLIGESESQIFVK
jgi:hypothetical protein